MVQASDQDASWAHSVGGVSGQTGPTDRTPWGRVLGVMVMGSAGTKESGSLGIAMLIFHWKKGIIVQLGAFFVPLLLLASHTTTGSLCKTGY